LEARMMGQSDAFTEIGDPKKGGPTIIATNPWKDKKHTFVGGRPYQRNKKVCGGGAENCAISIKGVRDSAIRSTKHFAVKVDARNPKKNT